MDLDKLTSSIKQHEGTGPIQNGLMMPYKDSLGNLTQGWGHLVADGISNAAGKQILSDDIGLCVCQAQTQDWWPCVSDNDARSNAMLELLFVLGSPKLDEFVNTLAALRNRDYETAANEIINSTLDHQDGQRINVQAEMIRSGEF